MAGSRAGLLARKLARGLGALALADLVLGMTAFSSISLVGLWVFSFGWIRLAGEYHAIGGSFGSAGQLQLAWIGELVTLPLLGVVLFLGAAALRVPWSELRALRSHGARPRLRGA